MRKFLFAQQAVRDLKRHVSMSVMAPAAICTVLSVRHGRMTVQFLDVQKAQAGAQRSCSSPVLQFLGVEPEPMAHDYLLGF